MIASCLRTFGLHFVVGVHWSDPVQQEPAHHSHVGGYGWQAPPTADTPNLHGRVMGIDAPLLGSGPSSAPRNLGSVENFVCLVSLPFYK